MSDTMIMVYYLLKGQALSLQISNGETKTFAPSALVTKSEADKLLAKQVTVGGCCGKPSRTLYVFATEEQLKNNERTWIE